MCIRDSLGGVDYTPAADAKNTPDSLITALSTLQAADGSFGYTYGDVTYVDAGLTAQAVTALAPYYCLLYTSRCV